VKVATLALCVSISTSWAGPSIIPKGGNEAAVTRTLNIQYRSGDTGERKYLRLDVYEPANAVPNCPVVLYVHGGAWQAGDKSNKLDGKLDL